MDPRHPLTRYPLFHGLPDEELAALRSRLRRCQFGHGEVLFHEGDPPGDIYFVMSGAVKLFVGGGPTERVFGHVLPGESVGEIAALDGSRRSTSGMAVAETDAYCISADDFVSFAAHAPTFCLRLLRLLAARLRRADEHAADLIFLEQRHA